MPASAKGNKMFEQVFDSKLALIARALILALLLGALGFASLSLAGCGGSSSEDSLDPEEYSAEVTRLLGEFDGVMNTYTSALSERFGAFTVDDRFSDEDVSFIAEKADAFEGEAERILVELEALSSPEEHVSQHRAIAQYAAFVRETMLPEITSPMRAITPGQGVGDFRAVSNLDDQETARLQRLYADYEKACADLGITPGKAMSN